MASWKDRGALTALRNRQESVKAIKRSRAGNLRQAAASMMDNQTPAIPRTA